MIEQSLWKNPDECHVGDLCLLAVNNSPTSNEIIIQDHFWAARDNTENYNITTHYNIFNQILEFYYFKRFFLGISFLLIIDQKLV